MALYSLLSQHSQLAGPMTVEDLEPILRSFCVDTTHSLADLLGTLNNWLSLGSDRPLYRNVWGACKRTEQPWNPELVAFTQADMEALVHCANFLMLPTWLNDKYLYPETLQRYLSSAEDSDWRSLFSVDEATLFEVSVAPILEEMKSEIPMTRLSYKEVSDIMRIPVTLANGDIMRIPVTLANVYDLTHNNPIFAALMGVKEYARIPMLTLHGGHISEGADLFLKNPRNDARDAVTTACASGSMRLIRHIEGLGIPIVKYTDSTSELQSAIGSGNLEMVRYIAEKLSMDKLMANRRFAIELGCAYNHAISQSRRDILDFLQTKGAILTSINAEAAAYHNNLPMLRYIMECNSTIKLTDEVIRQAIRHNNIDMIQYAILEKQCPLHVCLPYLCWEKNRSDILRFLMTRTNMPNIIQSQPHGHWAPPVHAFIAQCSVPVSVSA
jgi:hypothetical protein